MSRALIKLTALGLNSPARVLASSSRGRMARSEMWLDEKDFDDYTYIVIIPRGVRTGTASFWAGLFGVSIAKLGREKFMEKYSLYQPFQDERLTGLINFTTTGGSDE